ncbi:MAG: glycosyltransferase family 8 protein [Clostridia bacterium]|nr:glycosyltransferase family 8 protein [Clostridia bacterium]
MNPAKPIIPIFFAVDDNYAPYLAVSMRSLIDNASPDYQYNIYILIDKLNEYNTAVLCGMATDNVSVETINVTRKLDAFGDMLHLRDYYTKTTYYRFFIPALFPQYERGLYLDCDIVVKGDISQLYNVALGDNILAAAPEEVMLMVDVFGTYVEAVLEVPRNEYFSAGILVMNLEKMRRVALEEQFVEILGRRTFRVTQDQDYLNVLCRGDFLMLDSGWNKTACYDAPVNTPVNIIHYKINWKPWHYKGVRFEEDFWHYAEMTPYANMLYAMRDGYSDAQIADDQLQYENLVAQALSDTAKARSGILV